MAARKRAKPSELQMIRAELAALTKRIGEFEQHTRTQLGRIDERLAKLEKAARRTKRKLTEVEDTVWGVRARQAYRDGPPRQVLRRATGASITGTGTRSRGQSGYLDPD